MITDPQAIRFCNEVVRPKAETIRALKAEVDAAMLSWYGGMNTLIPNQAGEAVGDGREAEGVSRLSGADVNSFMALLANLQTRLSQTGVADVMQRPCVRVLRAE